MHTMRLELFFEAATWSEIAGTIPAMGAQLFFG